MHPSFVTPTLHITLRQGQDVDPTPSLQKVVKPDVRVTALIDLDDVEEPFVGEIRSSDAPHSLDLTGYKSQSLGGMLFKLRKRCPVMYDQEQQLQQDSPEQHLVDLLQAGKGEVTLWL